MRDNIKFQLWDIKLKLMRNKFAIAKKVAICFLL